VSFCTAVGYNALAANTNGASTSTAVGTNALAVSTSGSNEAFGDNASALVNTGTANTLIGSGAGGQILGGSHNGALGTAALPQVTSGSWNCAVGQNAGSGIVTGTHNTFIGCNALASSDVTGAIAIGGGTSFANAANATISNGLFFPTALAAIDPTLSGQTTPVTFNPGTGQMGPATPQAGIASLVGGTGATAPIAANIGAAPVILFSVNTPGGTPGTLLSLANVVAGAPGSFQIFSNNPNDTSTISWFIADHG
jgi:hypothetical protein